MLITDQVATAPCTDCVQVTFEAKPVLDSSLSGFKLSSSVGQGADSSSRAHAISNVAREALGCSIARTKTWATSTRAIRYRSESGSGCCVSLMERRLPP